jgi:Fe2+ transport system protein FeoA
LFGFRQRHHQHGQRAPQWRCECEQYQPGLSLLTVNPGQSVRILRIHCSNTCGARLRELGIVEGAVVELVKRDDPVLLYAKDTRIGLDPRTAAQIEVEYAGADEQAA